ncbi:MAG TPA: hypothetical protein DDW65_08720 [Firmicutes bacterium]|jgi:hypothetical protein|nr:hypothetical protein [Bacillota bacterium]
MVNGSRVLLVSLVVVECAESEIDYGQYLGGDYWRHQALEGIIPFWLNTLDKKNGGYFTDVDRTGVIGTIPLKYPRMVSWLIYGFSVAYVVLSCKLLGRSIPDLYRT